MRQVTRFVTRDGLNDVERDALLRAFWDARTDAVHARFLGRRALARQYAETCRRLVAAFGRRLETPHVWNT